MHPEAARRLAEDEEEAPLLTLAEALRKARDDGALSEVLQLLSRGVKRVDSSSSSALEHFEFEDGEVGYRDAGAPLERMLSAHDVAQILASTLESIVRTGAPGDDVSHILRSYFDMHGELAPLVHHELKSPAALPWLVSAAPERMLMSFDAMWALARTLTVRPALEDESIDHLALGIPHIKKSKRAAMLPLVHALAASTHPKAAAVLAALHEEGIPLDAKWHGMRPLDRAWAAGANQTVALLSKVNKPAFTEPKRAKAIRERPRAQPKSKPTAAAKAKSWRDLKNPLAKVPVGLAFVFAWLLSWAMHAFGLPLLGATLPMIFLVLYRLDPRRLRWPREPRQRKATIQESALAFTACIMIHVLQTRMGSAASILILALAFSFTYITRRLEIPLD